MRLSPLDYVHLQLKLEGLALKDDGRLTRLADSREPLPLGVIARTADGQRLSYWSEALPVEWHRDLTDRARQLEFPNVEVVLLTLQTSV